MPGSPWGGKAVVAKIGARSSQRGVRLYMVPAISECNGGQGTDTFDMLRAMEQWVEQGKTPEDLQRSGQPGRCVELCL